MALFLISLVFVLILIKSFILPVIFEKNKQSLCKASLSLKESSILGFFSGIAAKTTCNSIEIKKIVIENREDVLYYLLNVIKKSCDTLMVDKQFLFDGEFCPYTVILIPEKKIKISSLEISQLTNAIIPLINKPLYEYCINPQIVSEDITLIPPKKLVLEVCIYHEKNKFPIIKLKRKSN